MTTTEEYDLYEIRLYYNHDSGWLIQFMDTFLVGTYCWILDAATKSREFGESIEMARLCSFYYLFWAIDQLNATEFKKINLEMSILISTLLLLTFFRKKLLVNVVKGPKDKKQLEMYNYIISCCGENPAFNLIFFRYGRLRLGVSHIHASEMFSLRLTHHKLACHEM